MSTNISSNDDSSLSIVPSDLLPNLTRQCLSKVREQLTCHVRRTEDNDSRLICEPRHAADNENTGAIHAVFISVVVVTVVLTVVLNLVVLVTIAVNKKLHTLLNYLVSLLCANQLLWVIVPVIEADIDSHMNPFFCKIRFHTLRMTVMVNFGLIITITLLRYLVVVRNQRYHAGRQNILMFTLLAGIPTVFRTAISNYEDNGRCGSLFAWTPDDYAINVVPPRNNVFKTFISSILEYAIGIAIIFFCYAKILSRAQASKKRLMGHTGAAGGALQQRRQHDPATDPASVNRNPRSAPTGDTMTPESRPKRQALHQSTTSQHSVQNQPSAGQPSVERQPSGSQQSSSDQPSTSQETVFTTEVTIHQSTNIALLPNTVRSTTAVNQQYLTVPSATGGRSRRRRRSTHVVVAWSDSPEPDPGAQVTDRRHEPAGEVILSAATLKSSASPAPSPSSSTSGGGGGGAGTSHRPADAGSGSAQPGRGLAPGRSTIRRGRSVDIVATMVMIAFLVTFVLSFTPYLVVGWFFNTMKSMCVIMPRDRILIFICVVMSGGITGTLNPLVCVVFSSEFRKAFWKTCAKFMRWLSG